MKTKRRKAAPMDLSENNLLLNLHRWAVLKKQEENFFTEAFSHLLGYLAISEPEAAVGLLKNISKGKINISPANIKKADIVTQKRNAGSIIPDITISAPRKLLYIENKIEAPLGPRQIKAYRKLLRRKSHLRPIIIYITKYGYGLDLATEKEIFVRWFRVATCLETIIRNCRFSESRFLIRQFKAFLEGRNMVPIRANHRISAAIAEYERTGYSLRKLGRLRNLDMISDIEELLPLHNILMMMGEAAKALKLPAKLDSGRHWGGWIGYSIDKLKFFFVLLKDNWDEINFFNVQYFKIDASKWNEKRGKLESDPPELWWEDKLKLNREFLGLSRDEQMSRIEEFLKKSYIYINSLKKTR